MYPVRPLAVITALALSAISPAGLGQPTDKSAAGEFQRLIATGTGLLETRVSASIDSSVVIFETALKFAKSHFGPRDTTVARAMMRLATAYFWVAQHNRTRELTEIAADIWRQSLGPENAELGHCFRLLSNSQFAMGKFSEAEATLKQGIAILEKTAGDNTQYRHQLTIAYQDLADIYWNSVRYEQAEELLLRVRDMRRKLFGENSYWYAKSIAALGNLYYGLQKFDLAEMNIKDAIRILSEVRGADSYNVGNNKNRLALLYIRQGRYEEADTLAAQAYEIVSRTVGLDHFRANPVLLSRRMIELHKHNFPAALDCSLKYLENDLRARGRFHPFVKGGYMMLGRTYAAAGEIEMAGRAYDSMLIAGHRFLQTVFPYASETQKLKFAQAAVLMESSLLSLAVQTADKTIRESAYKMILESKSVVIDALANDRSVAVCSEDKRITSALDSHRRVCCEIAGVVIEGGIYATVSQQRQLDSLFGVKDSLERTISSLCSEFAGFLDRRSVSVSEVAGALDTNSVLWDITSYRPFHFECLDDRARKWEKRHYVGTAITRNGLALMLDLGDGHHIEMLVDSVRQLMDAASDMLYEGREKEAENQLATVLGDLYTRLLQPVESLVSQGARVYICPDRTLNLLPFQILLGHDGKYALEKYEISVVSTGRDLLKFQTSHSPTQGEVVILTDPNFDSRAGSAPADNLAPVALRASRTGRLPTRGNVDVSACLSVPFDRLRATSREAAEVEAVFNSHPRFSVSLFAGDDATESVVKSVSQPLVLHLATHGYFCESSGRRSSEADNPLLYSGLAFAGANRVIAGGNNAAVSKEDGILTALEASGLDLMGTELVVLSACQSGFGEVVSGEGVFGLRRALEHAGARAAIMSMFAVPDESTAILMERFYENWLSGQSKSAALRNASLSMMRERRKRFGAAHPLYWGGFVLVGDPN